MFVLPIGFMAVILLIPIFFDLWPRLVEEALGGHEGEGVDRV